MRKRKTLKSWAAGPGRREVIKRAGSDLARGLKDTDCRSPSANPQGASPLPKPRKRPAS